MLKVVFNVYYYHKKHSQIKKFSYIKEVDNYKLISMI